MSVAVLFPGQGSQTVGMGADLFDEHPDLLGDLADETLGWSLRKMCLEGPEDSLTRTEHAQPALFAISYALWVSFRRAYDGPIAGAAGHSLGEFTALAAAGVLGFSDALAVVATRGRAMATAADAEPSGMAALIGADESQAVDIASRSASDGGSLQVANLNAPGQVVMAGSTADIEWLSANARDMGVRRVIPLKVAGAFHSTFMESATAQVGAALESVAFSEPEFPVWSNTTARPHVTSDLAATLTAQMVSPVRFADSLVQMGNGGIDTFVHVGPGDVTAGMARRTLGDARVEAASAVADIPDAVQSLVTMG